MPKFIISVQREDVVETTSSDWVELDKEYAEDGKPVRGKMGYGPPRAATRVEKREIYQQVVDQLDLAELVSLVNGI